MSAKGKKKVGIPVRKYRITGLCKFITVSHDGTCRDWYLVVIDAVYKAYQEVMMP